MCIYFVFHNGFWGLPEPTRYFQIIVVQKGGVHKFPHEWTIRTWWLNMCTRSQPTSCTLPQWTNVFFSVLLWRNSRQLYQSVFVVGYCHKFFFKVTGPKNKDNKYIIDFIEEICCIKDNGWYMHLLETNEGICRQCFTKLKIFHSFSKMLKTNISVDLSEKVALERDCWCLLSQHHLCNHQVAWQKKRRKLFFSPKKCDFIDDHQYSSKAMQHKGMSVLCCHRKAYFKSFLHNYFNIIIISLWTNSFKLSVILLTKE